MEKTPGTVELQFYQFRFLPKHLLEISPGKKKQQQQQQTSIREQKI